MTAHPFTAPQAQINAAVIRAERRASRIRLRDITLAACLCLALLQLARVGLDQALNLQAIAAQSLERNLP